MIKSAELENSAYEFEAKMPLRHAVPLGLQHVFAMFVGNLTPLLIITCLLYTSPSPRDLSTSRMPSSA